MNTLHGIEKMASLLLLVPKVSTSILPLPKFISNESESTEAYSKSCQASKMKCFLKIVNSLNGLAGF